jgi:hypothetical protein
MRADIILTTLENGQLVETVIGHTNVTLHTDYQKLLKALAANTFGTRHVRRDTALFGYTAVDATGDTIHIQ